MIVLALMLQAATPEPGLQRCRAAVDEHSRRATVAIGKLRPGSDAERLLRGELYRAGILRTQIKAWHARPGDAREARALSRDALEAQMTACEAAYGPKDE